MTDILLARLEAATEGSRELDAEIFRLHRGREPRKSSMEQIEPSERLTPYTTSIDSAVTLLPAGWRRWLVENEATSDGRARAWVHERAKTGRGRSKNAFAATPALALCIAALRAMDNDKDGKAG